MPVDVREDENAIEISASLPGVAKDDIDISVEHGVLTIQAKTAEAGEAAGEGYVLRERRAGSFHRALRLSDRLDAAAATSSFNDGVLTVTVPKLEASKPKRIEVTVA